MADVEMLAVGQLGEYADAWDSLVDQMDPPSPSLRSWWVDNAAIGEPVVLLVVDQGRLVGGLALQRWEDHGCERIEMLGGGQLAPDHLDIVALPDDVDRVWGFVRSWLLRPGQRRIDLIGLRAGSQLLGISSKGVESIDPAPYVLLPATWAEYVASRAGRVRSTITRTDKRLTKAGVTYRVVPADRVSHALEVFRELHDLRWSEESSFIEAWAAFDRAARAGAARNEVVISELVDASGRVIASEVDFLVGGRLSFYQAGRLTEHELRGSGSMLKARILAGAIAAGVTEFDLLRGDEPYKVEWADAERDLMRVRLAIGWRAKLLLIASRTWYRIALIRIQRAAAKTEATGPAERTRDDTAQPDRVTS